MIVESLTVIERHLLYNAAIFSGSNQPRICFEGLAFLLAFVELSFN